MLAPSNKMPLVEGPFLLKDSQFIFKGSQLKVVFKRNDTSCKKMLITVNILSRSKRYMNKSDRKRKQCKANHSFVPLSSTKISLDFVALVAY